MPHGSLPLFILHCAWPVIGIKRKLVDCKILFCLIVNGVNGGYSKGTRLNEFCT